MPLYQAPVICNTAPSASAVNYNGIFSVIGWSTDITIVGNTPQAGGGLVITDMVFVLQTAPGAGGSGKQWTFDVGTNVAGSFVASGITVTISETAVTATWTGSVTFNQGDIIVMRSTPANTPTAPGNPRWRFKHTSTYQWVPTGITNLANVQVATRYVAPTHGGQSSTEANEPRPLPCDVTAGNISIVLNTDPGSGKAINFTLMKHSPSGGRYTGTGSSTGVVLTITGNGSNSITATYTGSRISFAKDDLLFWQTDGTSGMGAAIHAFIGYDLDVSTVGGTVIMLECVPTAQGTTDYIWGGGPSTTTEANTTVPVYACTAQNFRFLATAASSNYNDIPNTKTIQGTVRKNSGNTGSPTATITGTGAGGAQQGIDDSTTLAYADADTIDFQFIAGASTGADSSVHCAVLLVMAQPAGRTTKNTHPYSLGGNLGIGIGMPT